MCIRDRGYSSGKATANAPIHSTSKLERDTIYSPKRAPTANMNSP